MTHRFTRADARRFAVRAQLLTDGRPGGIVEAIDGLTLVNIDPTAAVAPSADHILWSRIGWPYQPADLVRAIEEDRAIFEWAGFYRPMSDLPLYRPLMRAWPPYRRHREWLEANSRFHRDVLDRLRIEGPLRGGEIPDTSQVSWTSTGWTNDRNVTQMLEFLVMRGEVAISGRDGKERVWDIAERVYPSGDVELSPEDAARRRAERRLGCLGLARPKAPKQPVEPLDVGDVGEEATIDGVPGLWRVDPALLADKEDYAPRTALLSPFDRLVGKLDAAADRKQGVFRVAAIHEDEDFSPDVADAVHAEIRDLAAWLGLEVTGIPGS